MKRTILTALTLLSLVILLASCSGGVSQEQYNKVSNDLTAVQSQIKSLQSDNVAAQSQIQSLQSDKASAQSQIQSLQSDKQVLAKNSAVTLAYIEFLDVLMYPAWKQVGLTTRFTFAADTDWLVAIKNRATNIGDIFLTNNIQQLEKGGASANTAMYNLMDYCLGKVEGNLK
jgi:outer membrane murein-binding lipoprotein Lpp